MKLIQVYFLSMTLYRISKGQQHHEEGEVAAPTQIYNQVTADVEDNDAHLRREGSSLKRMCFNVSLQMSAKISFGPSKYIPVSMTHLTIPGGEMASDPYSCEDNLMRMFLNFTDPAEPRLSRNLTIDFSSQENESGEVLYWISGISAYLQTEFSNNDENDATDDEYIELRSVEENPLSVMAVMGSSYTCQEPRDAEMAAFLVTEGNTEEKRRLKTAVMKTKWMKIIKRNITLSKTVSTCPNHSRDFIPKVVGLSLVGIIAAILIFWCIGRKTVKPVDDGYNNMTSM